jgi:hypothetical protein
VPASAEATRTAVPIDASTNHFFDTVNLLWLWVMPRLTIGLAALDVSAHTGEVKGSAQIRRHLAC